jgi:hypothetical protein
MRYRRDKIYIIRLVKSLLGIMVWCGLVKNILYKFDL